jgi:hypothetical protein
VGIAARVALSGVGKNLQDHISAPIAYARNEPGPLHRAMRLDRIARELATAYFLGKGIATDLPAGAMAFLRSPYAHSLPDVQFIFISAPMTAAPYLAPFKQGYQDGERGRPSDRRQCESWGAGPLQKRGGDPMNRTYSFQKAPRCSATSKRTRERCKAPAVRGWSVCRFHGARGGGPRGKRNGMFKHGLYTNEAVKERRLLRELIRQSRRRLST